MAIYAVMHVNRNTREKKYIYKPYKDKYKQNSTNIVTYFSKRMHKKRGEKKMNATTKAREKSEFQNK